jgi:Sulfotransferase domain
MNLLCNPFEGDGPRPVIVHGTYHKMGTVWLENVLSAVASYHNLRFTVSHHKAADDPDLLFEVSPETPPPGIDIFMQGHSQFLLEQLPPFVGSHMIRDPRDVVVSGYYYHLWCEEPWVDRPIKLEEPELPLQRHLIKAGRSDSISYKQLLNSVSREEGISLEILRFSQTDMRRMAAWNYDDPRFYEIKYCDLILDEDRIFYEMFKHYGFTDQAANRCVEIARRLSFRHIAKREEFKRHLRSGRAGQWREEFNDEHKQLLKALHGQDLIKLGYEKDLSW